MARTMFNYKITLRDLVDLKDNNILDVEDVLEKNGFRVQCWFNMVSKYEVLYSNFCNAISSQ